MLDAMIASALRKLINTQFSLEEAHQHAVNLPKKSVEEQRAQNSDRILRGKTNCLHERRVLSCNRSIYGAVQGVADLVTVNLHNDDVQDFDVRWECTIISERNTFTCDLGRIFQFKISELCSTSDCDGLL